MDTVWADLSEGTEPQLTAGEEVGGRAGEEDRAPSQGADQATDAPKQQQHQAEGKHHHYCTVHVCL